MILCTFPGRFGDLLWALPTLRALAEHTEAPVALQIAGEFAALVPLLQAQHYLGEIYPDEEWAIADPAAEPPTISPGPLDTYHFDRILHLGYRRWPELPLPIETYQTALRAWGAPLPGLDLTTPWIDVPPVGRSAATFFGQTGAERRIAAGWSECHFELKVGLMRLLGEHDYHWQIEPCMGEGGRWGDEAGLGLCTWSEAARCIHEAEIFVGDCSALHVLAAGMGRRVVLCEPMDARWNPIFYPLGTEGPAVTLVKGLDGKPTFDARHVAEAIERILRLSEEPADGR